MFPGNTWDKKYQDKKYQDKKPARLIARSTLPREGKNDFPVYKWRVAMWKIFRLDRNVS